MIKPVPKQHSAATILELIDSLDAAEKRRLFGLLAYHPDNYYVADLLDKGLQLAKLAKAGVESSDRNFQEVVNLAKQLPKRRIPPKHRTVPLTLKDAAKLMGYSRYRSDKDAVELLSKSIQAGVVAAERQNRQRYVFDLREFPESSHRNVAPRP